MADRFPSPFEMPTPPGAEGWKDLYAYSSVFSDDRREYEDGAFWFMDGVHTPEVILPWDATILEYAIIGLSQYNTRHYVIPPALGVDLRFLNGYMYLSPVGVADPEEIGARVPEFAERAGYYFANWDRLYAAWLPKLRALIEELETISFPALPHREDMAVITEGRGTGSSLGLLTTYHKLIDLTMKLWHHHFEFLNLGYAAYLDFFGACKQLFPSIPDQAIAKMVAGIQVDLFRPDEELKKLAQLAVELDVAGLLLTEGAADDVLATLRGSEGGDKWLAAWEEAKQPWFNFSAGSGFYHSDKVWLEYLDIPLGFLRTYITKVQRGESLERPMEAVVAERDRIVEEYTELIDSDEDRATFGAKLGLARTVFPYVENHNFYVEHWAHSVVWRKMRDLGRMLVEAGFFENPDDVFLLSRHEVPEVLFDLYHGWAVGAPSRGPVYWPREMARRSAIMNALRQWSPPPALGVPPEVITEPFTVMLWGITSESVKAWLGGSSDDGSLSGFAASPGIAEGPARVILSADGIADLQEGEILVAPLTAPSWAPVFGKIAATVTDVGGIMSHAAIVCREYGLPAVTGTAFGTKNIKTGQRLRVDGNEGTVTVLD
jgi:pyruvate, water dikinase